MMQHRIFRGQINSDYVSGKGNSVGKLKVLDGAKVEIDELSFGVWSEKYKKDVLPKISCLRVYKEYCTHTKVRFVVEFDPAEFSKLKGDLSKFEHILKLSSSINSQFNLFDSNTILRSFQSTGEILKEFYSIGLDYYKMRKTYLEGKLTAEIDKLETILRYLRKTVDKSVSVIINKKGKEMVKVLRTGGYAPDPVMVWSEKIYPKNANTSKYFGHFLGWGALFDSAHFCPLPSRSNIRLITLLKYQ
jgi:hypothetical protein